MQIGNTTTKTRRRIEIIDHILYRYMYIRLGCTVVEKVEESTGVQGYGERKRVKPVYKHIVYVRRK